MCVVRCAVHHLREPLSLVWKSEEDAIKAALNEPRLQDNLQLGSLIGILDRHQIIDVRPLPAELFGHSQFVKARSERNEGR